MQKIKHIENCRRVFKNYDPACARCNELAQGAPARAGWNDHKIQFDQMRARSIRDHNCKSAGCMSVCVAFDW